MSETRGKLWIGPSGWSYPDWRGTVYPAVWPRGFRPLRLIGSLFNAAEVNSSFYSLPAARTTERWPADVPAAFRFAFKLTRVFTHERAEYPGRGVVAAFCEGVRPVREAGKLGPLLMQFPWSFRFTPEAVAWLRRLADDFGEFERFVEVRHSSWGRPEGLEAVRSMAGWCNIDQPRLRDCLGPSAYAFGGRAYFRFHGRNAANWFAEGQPSFERYNYLYSEAELREWVGRIDAACDEAESVYVFTNNHYRGQGVTNALELRAMLEGGRPAVPPELMESYPRLRQIAAPPREPGLFDALGE